ncbi:hypothetical protein P280DRAFT_466719 [Massarina eburnea CBS 473.64]|uniref:N-acetyltransferase domain-containing protein n=1 Tax=Massarina eburnea CBS 473.64 TaxID=1395130 RepID=A0A6A6SB02_9PLEO|nr:hypothetical protein P280DRAFT_466719 [Massarina eburnea CBS 473.64]
MATPQGEKRRRFAPGEVIISEVTKEDLKSVAEGYYASFPTPWFDKIEPKELRPAEDIRATRFATRMIPWLDEPHTRWTKATLSPSSPEYDASAPNRVIGHAGWLRPGRTKSEILNLWRRDASDLLGWREKMGWTQEFEDELWSGTDLKVCQDDSFVKWDIIREGYLSGVGHWHLAPLWVVPEHQGRGVASLLIKDAIALADQEDPVPPMYLEAMKEARPIYAHFGYQGIEGVGRDAAMIRNPPEGITVLTEET